MMKYFFLLLVLLSLENANLLAQKGEIEGLVVDGESSENIPFASVAALDINTGTPVKGTVSDNSGKFIIEDLPPGRYKMMISFIGYETDSSRYVEISDQDRHVDMGTITLGISKIALQ